ncbi:MAG: hypothetical protein K2X36_00370, partial [Microbacteriaceae bacterium]|nr:hypothetical protein [Microbacteriaceae bacterium]
MADDADSRARYESALATEYFVLKGSSGATISESSSRSSLYMVSLSSSLIALGFVLNASEESFLSFAAASRSLGLHRANRRAVFFTMSTVIG